WEETFEAQRGIITNLQNEIANLRAGEPPEAAENAPLPRLNVPQTLAQMFNRAVDVLAHLDSVLNEGSADLWPKKVMARARNRQINEVRHFLARLRGFRDVVELHSDVPDEEPRS